MTSPNPDGASKLREQLWAMRKRLGHNGIVLDIDELIVFIESSVNDAIAATKEACAAECDRHAEFCKSEAHKGGNFEHLMTRKAEADYLAERIRALPGPDLSAANCGQYGHEYGDGCADCREAKAALTLFAGQVTEHRCQFDPTNGSLSCTCGAKVAGVSDDYEKKWAEHILALVPNPNALAEHDAALVARIEQLECQLAGCDVAAMGWADKNPLSPAPQRGAWGWSPAFQSVLELRHKWEALKAQIAELQQSGTLMINKQWVEAQIASAEVRFRALILDPKLLDNLLITRASMRDWPAIQERILELLAEQQAEAKEEK
jgi:hypothetical protein